MPTAGRAGHPAPDWAGHLAGDDENPAKYRLERWAGGGAEGTVWRAVSRVAGADERWALKIVDAGQVSRQNGESPGQALRRWKRIWSAAMDRTRVLHNVPGIIPGHEAFAGAMPHPDRTPPPHSDRALYLVSPWVDGPTLGGWRKYHRPDLAALVDVVTQLCDVVDRLADRRWVHRDLCPNNVMLTNGGQVCLIDFAFMLRAGTTTRAAITKPGYSPPEAYEGRSGDASVLVDPATDRYSVGAIVYHLFTGECPPPAGAHRVVRRRLERYGFRAGLARHVAALLNADPGARPARLGPWAADLRRLAVPTSGPGYRDVAMALNGRRESEIIAGGAGQLAAARVSLSTLPVLVTRGDGPSDVESVAVGRRGDGQLVVLARDVLCQLTVRVDDRWRTLSGLRAVGSVRAAELGDGGVRGYVSDEDGHLVEVSVPLTGEPTWTGHDVCVHRIHTVTCGPGGRPALAIETEDGRLRCGPPDALRPVSPGGTGAVALCVNDFEELLCVAAQVGGDELEVFTDGLYPKRYSTPAGIRDVACLWLRTGLAVALATDSGLFVSGRGLADWTRLWPGPVSRAVLALGAGWRLQVVALTDGGVVFADETAIGTWPGTATAL